MLYLQTGRPVYDGRLARGGRLSAALLCLGLTLALPGISHAGILTLDFSSAVSGSIQDRNGVGTGLTARLPGTGSSIATNDPNLTLNAASGTLSVFGSYSDLNGQLNLASGEYAGVNLGSLGFTGSQNFSVSARFNSVAYNTNGFTQFGIYVGTDSANVVRIGYINYLTSMSSFGIRNNGGTDANDGTFSAPRAPLPGDNVIYTLSRTAGVWTATVQNLTNPSRSDTLALNGSFSFLNASSTLHAGIFATNFWFNGGPSATATVDSFSVNVIPEPGSSLLVIGGMALLGVFRFRRPNG